jgi:hypothetical protein
MAGIKSNSCDRKEENYLMNGQQVQLIRRSTPRVLAMRASALFALAYAFAVRANAAAAGTLPWNGR